MKLLLTSEGWKKNIEIGREFLKLVKKDPSEITVFLVFTPLKDFKKDEYIKQLNGVGLLEENVKFFKLDRKVKKDDLNNIDVIFVMGGNTFDYLNRIKRTGLDKKIISFVENKGVYVGLSAGSYVTCPTIESATWKRGDRAKDLKGLNLVPFLITAHFQKKYEKIVKEAAQKTKLPIIAITDKQAILVKGKKVSIIGQGKKNVFNTKKKF